MVFQELLDYCVAKALDSKLTMTEESLWRSVCRAYSKKFYTPLEAVYKLDPEHVILNVFEDKFEEEDTVENIEKFLDQILTMADPDYRRQKEENMDAFVKVAEVAEQTRRQAMKLKEEKPVVKPNQPMSGSVNFGGLKNEG